MIQNSTSVFLTARWRYLAMLNYEIDPKLLSPFVPTGIELDSWNGKSFVSMVGFLFEDTRVLGIPIPFHRNFEEVNLRFYVRRETDDGWRRAVVFIKELVPRTAIAVAARMLYNENYVALQMAHKIERPVVQPEDIKSVTYLWRFCGNEKYFRLTTPGRPPPVVEGSEQEFITENYWGYSVQSSGMPPEDYVEHPPSR